MARRASSSRLFLTALSLGVVAGAIATITVVELQVGLGPSGLATTAPAAIEQPAPRRWKEPVAETRPAREVLPAPREMPPYETSSRAVVTTSSDSFAPRPVVEVESFPPPRAKPSSAATPRNAAPAAVVERPARQRYDFLTLDRQSP